jgi:hypothetical protein
MSGWTSDIFWALRWELIGCSRRYRLYLDPKPSRTSPVGSDLLSCCSTRIIVIIRKLLKKQQNCETLKHVETTCNKHHDNIWQPSWNIMKRLNIRSEFPLVPWGHGASPFWQHRAHVHRELSNFRTSRLRVSRNTSKHLRCGDEPHDAPPRNRHRHRESPNNSIIIKCQGCIQIIESNRIISCR